MHRAVSFLWGSVGAGVGLSGGGCGDSCGDWWGWVWGRAGAEVFGGVNGLGLRDNGSRFLIICVFATFYVILLLLWEWGQGEW